MAEFHIADDLDLPREAVTQTFSILAKRGSGKTYTGLVLAEEMLAQQQPLVVLDPVGVWWGLRSSADGKSPGYPVVIVGGEHGDLPLEPDAGELVANLVVDQDLAIVLDLSLIRKGQARTFCTDFLETLYRRNRRALHVFVDEADAFAPQRPVKGGERLLGAMEDLVRRGRARGIGVTLITQRPATLHKDVLTQTEVLIALRMTGPHDRKAIDEWVKQHGDEERRQQLLTDLASLPVGTAYFWSPGWLDLFQKVHVRRRHTFDSSATPEVGQSAQRPSGYADVDLDALRDQMAASVENAKADDPKTLKATIRQLRQQLADRPEPETVEVPAVDPATVARIEAAISDARTVAADIDTALLAALDQLNATAESLEARVRTHIDRLNGALDDLPADVRPRRPAPTGQRPAPRQPSAVPAAPDDADPDVKIKAGARRMLAALASPPGVRLTRSQVATLASMAPSGGTFSTYYGTLRRAGLITEDGDAVLITAAGLEVLGDEIPDAPRTPDEVVSMWRQHLKAGARRMLDELVAVYPDELSRQELGEAVDIEPSGGTFSTYLGTLRRNGLAETNGDGVRAGDAIFVSAGAAG